MGATLQRRQDRPEPGWEELRISCAHGLTSWLPLPPAQQAVAGMHLVQIGALARYHVAHCAACPDVRALLRDLDVDHDHFPHQ